MADQLADTATVFTPPNNDSPSSPSPVTSGKGEAKQVVPKQRGDDAIPLVPVPTMPLVSLIDSDSYSDDENAMIERGKQALSDLFKNKKKIKVRTTRRTYKSSCHTAVP
jgi:hypothetical protein